MNAHQFVKNCRKEKDLLIEMYFKDPPETSVGTKIKEMDLTSQQHLQLKSLVDSVLSETYYGFLLALDGSASLGDDQQHYKVFDEDGNLLSDCGQLEAEAYEQFHSE